MVDIGEVYVLELEDGCYYIGHSIWPSTRIKNHFRGQGARWTKLHKPVKVLARLPDKPGLERKTTLEYAVKYGWSKVRGADWCLPPGFRSRFPS